MPFTPPSVDDVLSGLADRFGGRVVFVTILAVTAIPAFLVSQVTSYGWLLFFAFLVGFAGNSFSASTKISSSAVARLGRSSGQ